MSGKEKIEVQCLYCNKNELVYPSRAKKYKFCSKECEGEYRKNLVENNTICPICQKSFHVKPSRFNRIESPCCSKECDKKHRSIKMSGEGNHQYGLKGQLNASFKTGERISNYGYKLVYMPSHPFTQYNGYIREHRLIAEKYLLNNENSIEINDIRYLKPELDVHHKDENKLNNNPNNLEIMTRSEHTTLHNKERIIVNE